METCSGDKDQFNDALPHWKYDNVKQYEMPAGLVFDQEKSTWLDCECKFQVCDGFHRVRVSILKASSSLCVFFRQTFAQFPHLQALEKLEQIGWPVLPENVLVSVLDGELSPAAQFALSETANQINHNFCPLTLWDKIDLPVRMRNGKLEPPPPFFRFFLFLFGKQL